MADQGGRGRHVLRRLAGTPRAPEGRHGTRDTADRLQGIVRSHAQSYLVLDPDLVIVDVNEAYLRAAGRSRQDLIGHHLFEALRTIRRTPTRTVCRSGSPSP
ncbi:PAS domain-containing protein [Streptomyces atratus]|uniref:PAS domain-containing protein n=1 Tax=Streptomyces atratus TaxID=1893 RepID=UPI001E447BEE|nr:PAS domain-containing protein [Streptomyces atratus]WPW32982.1 PAS domain-containing protein [Streptomyces atratus]